MNQYMTLFVALTAAIPLALLIIYSLWREGRDADADADGKNTPPESSD